MSVLLLLIITISAQTVLGDYWNDRQLMLDRETAQALGSQIQLTAKEDLVNTILMNIKLAEYDQGIKDPDDFLPAFHFFHTKEKIEQSAVFQFIKNVPKGASLHSHDTALVSFEYLYNLTYTDNLYGCVVDYRLKLHFFDNNLNQDCDWKLLSVLRAENATFDDFIKSEITIVVENPHEVYTNINIVWAEFLRTFGTVTPMICYRPIFETYFYQAFKELYEDNVMYIEFRSTLPEVYELNGTTYGPIEVMGLYKEVADLFVADHPDFHGVRVIYAPARGVDNKTFEEYVVIAALLKEIYGDFVAGFDLVGEEDKGRPLSDFVPYLINMGKEMKFFFHAAETNWNGYSTDLNIVDAVLLNTTRIGHGYGIIKHPEVLKAVKDKQIGIEICPVSNQVLKLVDDLRNHPGTYLVANGYPVVICSDDPTFWGTKALSYDWYMAFMAFGSRESDLKLLKQFAINSIDFSVMNENEKIVAMFKWEMQWIRFIDNMLKSHHSPEYYQYSYHVNQI